MNDFKELAVWLNKNTSKKTKIVAGIVLVVIIAFIIS